MKIFKTRQELKGLRAELTDLKDMLRTHFDIKWELRDYIESYNLSPNSKPTVSNERELERYRQVCQPTLESTSNLGKTLLYRGREVTIKK